jgi:hypothetical protein
MSSSCYKLKWFCLYKCFFVTTFLSSNEHGKYTSTIIVVSNTRDMYDVWYHFFNKYQQLQLVCWWRLDHLKEYIHHISPMNHHNNRMSTHSSHYHVVDNFKAHNNTTLLCHVHKRSLKMIWGLHGQSQIP